MTDDLTKVLAAMRGAQAELAAYLASDDRNAELTIARLVGMLDRREVVRAVRRLAPPNPGGAASQVKSERIPVTWHQRRRQTRRARPSPAGESDDSARSLRLQKVGGSQ